MTGNYTVRPGQSHNHVLGQYTINRDGIAVGWIDIRTSGPSGAIPFDHELAQAVAATFAEHERRVSGDSEDAG